MKTIIALILTVIFLIISIIHIYWAFGGKWGSGSVIPTKDNHTKVAMPGVLPTLMVAVGLLLFALFVLVKGELLKIDLPVWLNNYGLYILAGIFIIRAIGDFKYVGFFKKIKSTKFAQQDAKFYTPLCLLIGLLAIVLAN